MKKLFLLITFVLSLQIFPQKLDKNIIDNLVIKSLPIDGPGGSLLIMRNGKIEYEKAYGFADVENKIPNTVNTVFQIGSVSKEMTAAAILMLVEKGKLSLDDTLTKFIPDFIEPGNKVTIKNLLIHNSGIPNYTELLDKPFSWESKNSLDDIIDLIKNRKFDFQPGEKFKYDNSGYAILAYIIEKISGMSYAQFMKQNIFLPLGMKHTLHGGDKEDIGERAKGYTFDLKVKKIKKAVFTEFAQLAGAGSLISTTEDIAIWDEAVKQKKLLSTKSWNEALSKHVEASMFGDSIYYGYGWVIQNYFGHKLIWHTGGMAGFLCANYIFPEDNLIIIFLSNNDFVVPAAMVHQIANYILGIGVEDRKPITLSSSQLKIYEGTFKNPFTKIKIEAENNKLKFTPIDIPFHSIDYIASSKTTFYAEGQFGKKAVFTFDGDSVNEVEINNTLNSVKYFREGHASNDTTINLSDEYLQKFVGKYNFGNINTMQVYIENKKLKALLPGQPEYTLLPVDSTTFALGNLPGFKMIFDVNGNGEVTAVTSSQPNGDFKANKTSNEVNLPKEEAGLKLNEDEMKTYEGTYEFTPGSDLKVYIIDGELKGLIKGQPEYTLVSTAKNEFKLKGMEGFKFTFEEKDGKIISVTSHQPNGDFKAMKIK